MHDITKKVIEEAVRVRKLNLLRLEHLDMDVGEMFREEEVESTKKQIAELKEDLQILYEHAKR